jgi:ankyrin repeat protein
MAPSLLHLLAGSDSPQALESARALLDAGTNPDLRADDGLTPLHVAAAWDNVAMLQLLLLSKVPHLVWTIGID